MCGLTLTISTLAHASQPSNAALVRSLHAANSARGPNSQGLYTRRVQTPAGQILVSLSASVLGLRGEGVTAQPLVGKRGVLGWNGQVFSGLDVAPNENDTRVIFDKLEAGESPSDVLQAIEGPFAFIYLSTFILSSSRSAEARRQGVPMRALNGGEAGVVHLSELSLGHGDSIDFEQAVRLISPSNRVATVNTVAAPEVNLGAEPALAECDAFIENLLASVRRRVENIPAPVPGCIPVGEPIELVNVAFEEPRKENQRSGRQQPPSVATYNVPDRVSGRDAVLELQSACPGRDFQFVEVNVTVEESRNFRQSIVDVMYPSNTEMDISLAYPLYFASRGQGIIKHPDGTETPHVVTAKVYISGLGADEQLGGYSRHRRAFERASWIGLQDEVQMDLDRIPLRNLSRDDRVISSHARDARYPYLDLGFINYVSSLPIWQKCNFSLGPGHGDKLLIRLAAERCGLHLTSHRVKRAMQFGTKSAKLQESRPRGFNAGAQVIQDIA
ncbi:hypothetical protein Q8F55_001013 [Vanrija albida]|uniref:Asparagine synthetase domain-containing protein n=1 Tax=Vanrija albida TaxID=181172 RepID=A0ABR3QEV7_9TREE